LIIYRASIRKKYALTLVRKYQEWTPKKG